MHYICVWHTDSINLSKFQVNTVTNIEVVIRQMGLVMQELRLLVSVVTLTVIKNLLIEWTTLNQNGICCARVDCNLPAMIAMFEYGGSLA